MSPCASSGIAAAFPAITVLLVVACSSLVGSRLYVRVKIVHGLGWDDLAAFISLLLFLAAAVICFYNRSKGLGLPPECISPEDLKEALRFGIIYEPLIILSAAFIRISVALFVLRLFAVSKTVRVLLIMYTSCMALILLACAIASLFTCHPVHSHQGLTRAGCFGMKAYNGFVALVGVVSILSDLVLAILPAYFLRKLQMGLGFFVTAFPIGRTVFDFKLTENASYDSAVSALLVDLEAGLGLIAACIPAVRPLFTRRLSSRRSDPDSFALSPYPPSDERFARLSSPPDRPRNYAYPRPRLRTPPGDSDSSTSTMVERGAGKS